MQTAKAAFTWFQKGAGAPGRAATAAIHAESWERMWLCPSQGDYGYKHHNLKQAGEERVYLAHRSTL